MIAADTNAMVAFFSGEKTAAAEAVQRALADRALILPPVVQSELLSDPKASRVYREAVIAVPLIAILDGYWQRTGELRSELLRRGRKARLPDVLVAQSALDFDLPLITHDRDFRAIVALRKLRLI